MCFDPRRAHSTGQTLAARTPKRCSAYVLSLNARLGAHSVAGGLPFAIARAQNMMRNAAIFVERKPVARPAAPAEGDCRIQGAAWTGISPIVAHASYLINLATTSDTLRAQSIAALGEEVDRAEALGLLGVVLHPGARMAAPTEQALSLISSALTEVLKARPRGKTMILLEHTAGQGSPMGRLREVPP